MEEFYRRKYLSPTFSRSPSYAESVQKDKTVSELRKELQECKEMQQKFDDLCLDIVKLQRENKKIQSQQSLVEAEYIEKIKMNKAKITELKQAVLDCRENIEAKAKKVSLLETENARLSSEVDRLKRQTDKNRADASSLADALPSQEGVLSQTLLKIEQSKTKASGLRVQCQARSQKLEQSYQQLKENQARLRQQQSNNEQLRKRLQVLSSQRQLWQKKMMVSQADLEEIGKQVTTEEAELKDKQNLYKGVKEENQSHAQGFATNKKQLRRVLEENNSKALKLKGAQAALFQLTKNLQKDQSYCEKVSLKDCEVRKDNERLREVLKQLNEVVTEEQQAYSRVIAHMKQSIKQDEKAIEGLVKQASLIENMIN